jgi:hypothetical protein
MIRQNINRVIVLRPRGAVHELRATDEAGQHPRRFPLASTLPRVPAMIPDEILDYFGWLFCQGGFRNFQMTFEQFLAVVGTVNPRALSPECDVDCAYLPVG